MKTPDAETNRRSLWPATPNGLAFAAGQSNPLATYEIRSGAIAEVQMEGPNYQDRIERNYQVGVSEDGVAGLWRNLSDYLPRCGLIPIYEITCVGSVYFDNRDFDLTRYNLLNGGRYLLVRLRTYENYGESPKPISDYWIEVKIRDKERWRKKRFRLNRTDLPKFLEGKDGGQSVLDYNQNVDPDVVRNLYRETQETVLTNGLKPMLLLTYRRVAFQNEIERVCLDSDIQYYHVGANIYSYDSWKYPLEEPVGRSRRAILEVKYQGRPPAWITDLERSYPLRHTNFSKYVEGMGFLFQGPLKNYKESNYFLPRIEAYLANSERL
jgi:SPX domain protein involved in polyphosphate accumulation